MRRVFAIAMALSLTLTMHLGAQAVTTSASSAVVMDAGSGRVLYEQDMHTPRQIASITKLMTALVVLEHAEDLSQVVTVSQPWLEGVEGSSIYLKPGEEITVETLLYGLMLHSGNDAAKVLACWVAGDEEKFAERMNQKARDLGMEHSHFTNASGLTQEGHYSSAYDMALLACACLQEAKLAEICATKTITLEGRSFSNHNKLLWLEKDCVGMKTGFTEAAGRTLVSAAKRGEQSLVCVTLNDPDDWDDHQALLEYGFEMYPMKQLCQKDIPLGQVAVEGSILPSLTVVPQTSCWYPLGEGEELELDMKVFSPLSAPIPQGTQIGTASWSFHGTVVAQVSLVSGERVEADRWEPSRLQRWWMRLWGKPWEPTVPGMGLI